MTICVLNLTNFRCFTENTFAFNPKLNILVGNNATGKSTALEAIHCLSVIKSFRCSEQTELINDKSDYFYIKCTVNDSNKLHEIAFAMNKKQKKLKLDNQVYKKMSDHLGFFPVVTFSLEDFTSLKGTSKNRRTLLDLLICQISHDYVKTCNYYKKLLKERNSLLKRLKFENNKELQMLLEVYNDSMVNEGSKIISIRTRVAKKISEMMMVIHKKIAPNESVQLVYQPNTSIEDYRNNLQKAYQDDLKYGTTSIGPHRDDYIFIINNKNVVLYGSQGQQKNTLITYKLASAELIHEVKNNYPVILLDDVFGELDKGRQNALISSLNEEYQIIITAASITDLDMSVVAKANVIQF